MNNSVYYKGVDEDGNPVIKHAWKNHKYLYIKNGKYIYPEDIYKRANKVKQKVKNYFTSPGTNTKVTQDSYGSTAKIVVTKKDSPFVKDVKKSGAYKTAKKVSKDLKKTASNVDKNVSNLYKKTIYPHTEAGKIDALNKKYNAKQKTIAKQHKQLAAKDSSVKSGGSSVNIASIRKAKAQQIASAKKNIKSRSSTPYKGPTSAMNAKKAQQEKDLQARARAINARTVAMKKARQDEVNKMNTHLDNAYAITKKHNDQVRKEAAERKERPKKIAKKVIKIAAKDSAAKMAYAKYLANKASKSPTVVSAKNKAKSVASKAEYKVTRAGQKLMNDVKKTGAYKTAKRAVSGASKSASSTAKKVKSYNPKVTQTVAKNKAKSVASKAEYKVTRAGQKLTNDVKKSGAYKTAKKAYNSAEKAYSSAKKTASDTYKTAKKTYNTAKKKVKKAKKTYNKYVKQVSNYIDWLSK